MKIRIDFVTNSSSASYCLIFKTPGWSKENVIDRLIQCHNEVGWGRGYPEWIGDNEEAKKEYDAGIAETKTAFPERMERQLTDSQNGIFELHEYTIMHNSFTDGLPEYMQEFIFDILGSKGWEIIDLQMEKD